MLLHTLRLYNFRQFYGRNEIHFSRDSYKNVTLIHGENGVGKTTLLNAILWCFFERLSVDFEQKKNLVSFEAKREGKNECRVEVIFEYESNEYLSQRYFKEGSPDTTFKIFQIQDCNYREVPNSKNFINSILPRDMANYFFFHGEGISSISETRAGDKFRRSVRDILGFTFAEEAVSDLKKIKVQYGKRAKELGAKSEAVQRAAQRKSDLEEKLYNVKKQQGDVGATLREQEHRLEELETKLAGSGNADASRIKRELDSVRQRVAAASRDLKVYHGERQALIAKYGWAVFGAELASKGLEFIDESTLKGRIPSPYQEAFVRDLLKDFECICGRELRPQTVPYSKVLGLLETANTALISQRVMKARSSAANMTGVANQFLEEVAQIEEKLKNLDLVLASNEQDRQRLERELDDIDESAIQRLREARKVAQVKRDELLRLDERLRSELKRLEVEFDQAKRELQARGTGDQQLERLTSIQDIIDRMIERCQKRLEEFELGARKTIAETVDSILDRFARNDYSIRVNDAFEFFLVRRTDGGVVPKSKGENLLLNLAFVSALIDMAHRREKARGDFLVQGTVAPFVIDAPFGELDDTYRAATAEFLPETAKQLVLLLSSSHWKGTVDEAIRDRVGAEYVLVSQKRVERGEKPEDKLEIRDQEFVQSVYGTERDATIVKEIS